MWVLFFLQYMAADFSKFLKKKVFIFILDLEVVLNL